jgi:DNA-binding transcriptional LysR family regulator
VSITLTQLRSFLAVVRTGSVSAAAAELVVTQPSVSAAVGALSREVGVDLLEREGRGVRPTPAGREFAAYAADVAPSGMNAAAMSGFRMLADLGYVVGPISLGLATDLFGADAALGATAVLLAATALLFGRYAPELHRPGRL